MSAVVTAVPIFAPKRQGDPRRQRKQPLACHGNGDPDRGGGRLDNGGENRTSDNAEHGLFQAFQDIQEGLKGAQWYHRTAHQTHAIEHQPNSHDHHSVVLDFVLLGTEQHEKANRNRAQGISRQVESQ